MPYPQKDESKKDYLARFMRSSEAQSDFPDEKQRLAVAYSMYEKRNASPLSYGREHPWPKKYSCSFIEPGVVFYQDLGGCKVCGNAMACGNAGDECQAAGATVLVKQDALAKMAQSFVGKPVIDMIHKDVTPSTVADGEADGIVTRVWLDDKSGWWMAEFLVWNPEAQGHCESPAYSVSCAYEPTDVDSAGGEYHNIPYTEDILNGEYTHLALVTNPRYEGARIFVNSKGGKMDWKWFKRGERKNAASLDPLKTKVNVDGQDVALQDLYEAAKEDEAPMLNDDTVMEVGGKEKTLGELKQAYRNKMKKNAEAAEMEKKNAEPKPCPTCGEKKNLGKPGEETVPSAEKAEAGHSEHREGGSKGPLNEAPLPDLRDKKKENDATEDAAKKLDGEAKEKSAVVLEQEAGSRDEKDQVEEAAKKNADDEKAADLEKKNADELKKSMEEKLEKRNAGRKSFEALRNARGDLHGDAVKINPISVDERLAKGKSKYGSPA